MKLGLPLKINNVDIGLLDEFIKKHKGKEVTGRYCSMCTRLSGWKNLGDYEGENIVSLTGSSTLEDKLTDRIFGNIQEQRDGKIRKLKILEDLPEDVISLFAALKNIDYYVGDCPIQEASPQYYCRRFFINDIKRNTNWLYRGNNNIYSKCVVNKRVVGGIIAYNTVLQRSDGKWISIKGIKVSDCAVIVDKVVPQNNLCEDALEINFAIFLRDSWNGWMKKKGVLFIG